jgi:hypothetical protein
MHRIPLDWIDVARFTWNRLIAPGPGEVPHNCYLKLFVMDVVRNGTVLRSRGGRPFDVILVDEAQVRGYNKRIRTIDMVKNGQKWSKKGKSSQVCCSVYTSCHIA